MFWRGRRCRGTALAAVVVLAGSLVVAVSPVSAAPAPPSVAVRADAVPLLAARKAPPKRAAATPVPRGDFAPLAGRAAHFDERRSRPVSRSAFATEYANPDGTRTLRQSSQPLNVRDAAGAWRSIDTTVTVDPVAGRARVSAHPLNPTFGLRADDSSGVLRVETGGTAAWLTAEQAGGAAARTDGATVTYGGAWPGADLAYEVKPGSVKETIRLTAVPEKGRIWRFRLGTRGLVPKLGTGGGIELRDAKGRPTVVIPPVETWDSAGTATRPPAVTGGNYRLTRDGKGWLLSVSVDEKWLRDPARIYPVSIDPTFTFGSDDHYAYKSDGAECHLCGARIGNVLDQGDKYWRTVFHMPYQSLFGRAGDVVAARLDVANQRSATTVDRTYPATLFHASAFDYDGVGEQLASGFVGQVGSFSGDAFTTFLRDQVRARDSRAYFMLVGHEAPGVWSYKNLAVTLLVDFGAAPSAPQPAGPADESVLTTLTPTLAVNPVQDPDGDPVSYCFRVATGPDTKTGVVVESGCLPTPTWQVPPGVLQDGVAYTWRAAVYRDVAPIEPSWVGHFKIDQRIGVRGPAPADTMGPMSVNLANGNVTATASGPSFTTVGGAAGLTLTYNSQQREAKGLRASYFNDLSHNGNIGTGQQPVLVRTEPQVNVNWGQASPFPPALEADWFVVRWEGYFQAPVAGTYQLAGVHDDTLRIWLDNQQVYNTGCCSDVNWSQSTGVALSAGQRVPIRVELAEATFTAYLKLFVRTSDDGATVAPQIVPADWLSTLDSPALPQGWTLSADLDGEGGTYAEAMVADQGIVLTDATGAKHTWTKTSAGGYTPPEDEDGVLTLDASGRVTVTDGTEVYVFRADGKLETQTSTADSRRSSALGNLYDGTPSRLREIKDPVSGRSHRLFYNRPGDDCYGGATPPPGAQAAAPPQMLCRIVYWDGTQTLLWYLDGQLSRVQDPGAQVTDFAFWTNGPLAAVRDDLAADWVAVDPGTRNDLESAYLVGYDDPAAARPAATFLASPQPTPGQARVIDTYRRRPPDRQTFIDRSGLSPASGFYRRVTYDDAFRLLAGTDATGATTSRTWSVKDQELSSTDAAGRVSTTIYDHADRPVDEYGPAPATCFDDRRPTDACAATVPHQHTGYDTGLAGLAVAWYDNVQMAGAPKVYATGFGDTSGTMSKAWGETTPPAAGLPAGTFAARLTGEIQFPAAGDYRMELYVDNGARMWIDDKLIIDSWVTEAPRSVTGPFVNTAAGSVHRIRIDYYNGGGPGELQVRWQPPGGASQLVPGGNLRPRYGLTTSTTIAESGGVPDRVTTTRFGENGLDPAYGVSTSTTIGSGAVALTTAAGHEAPGTAYLRQQSETKPDGAQKSYEYYGDTETRANPCAAGSPAVNQGGLLRRTVAPSPSGAAPVVDEDVYDASGRPVARSAAGGWLCIGYDARDREVSRTYPATATAPARTVTNDHAVGGDPLTAAVSDPSGTVTTTVDLLGRPVTYTDVHGVRTTTAYDQPGRVSSETVDPPSAADPAQVTTYTYDDAGRVLTTKLGSTVFAVATYDAAGEPAMVTYANGSTLSRTVRDAAGRTTELTWRTSAGEQIASTVTRTRAGTIVDESLGGTDPRPDGPNYVYDPAGRMIEAWSGRHHYSYDFTSAAPSGCPAGTRSNAGANSNRVRLLDQTSAGTTVTGYCYDAADRLLGTVGGDGMTAVTYDSRGDVTGWTTAAGRTTLQWDGSDRNSGVQVTGAGAVTVGYGRDATDRLVRRDAVRYGYTGDSDTSDLTLAADGRLLGRTLALPGGVIVALQGGTQSWDHPSVRGDLVLTTDADGRRAGDPRGYDPYGDAASGLPDNQPGDMDFGWLGQFQRPYEHAGDLAQVQMGARPYLPEIGRFLSADPIDGGSANDYDYVGADPVNVTDLDGLSPKLCKKQSSRCKAKPKQKYKDRKKATRKPFKARRKKVRMNKTRTTGFWGCVGIFFGGVGGAAAGAATTGPFAPVVAGSALIAAGAAMKEAGC